MRRLAGFFGSLLLLASVLSPAPSALAAPPRNVELVGIAPMLQNASLELSGGYGYALTNEGLRVYDWSDPARPQQVGFVALPTSAFHVAVAGQTAYVTASNTPYIYIVDVATPAAPRLISTVFIGRYAPNNTSELPQSIAVVGKYLYVGLDQRLGLLGHSGELAIVDISQPRAPRKVTGVRGLTPYAMVTHGSYVYMTGMEWLSSTDIRRTGLRTLDVSQPGDPREVAFVDLPRTFSSFALDVSSSSAALFVVSEYSLLAFDLSVPAAPRQVGQYSSGWPVYDVLARGRNVFVSTLSETGDDLSLRVLDAGNPSSLAEVGSFDVDGGALLAAQDNFAYLQCDPCGGTLVLEYVGRNVVSGQVVDAFGAPVSGVLIVPSVGPQAVSEGDGSFALNELRRGTVSITPTLAGFHFLPPSRTVTLPEAHAWQRFVALSAPLHAAITPTSAGTLSYTDTKGLRTTVEWPAGAVGVTSTLTLTPTFVSDGGGFHGTGHALDLALSPAISLTAPISLTFRYADDARGVAGGEAALAMRVRLADGWHDAADVCAPAAAPDPGQNTVRQAACRAGTYALVGPTYQTRLPLVSRP